MSKKRIFIAMILILCIVIGAPLLWLSAKLTTHLDELDGRGRFITDVRSPTKEYTAVAYLIDDGGATVGAQLRIGITSYRLAERDFDDKTIYWDKDTPHMEDPQIKWIDRHTVEVNGVKIDIYDKDTYYNWKDHI
ncbi:hypothetical protein HPB58_09995 [Priestia filamentosa]|uniref:DUF5412 family protein n=1 Tax=Priestia filamentosa TaxID=1402861 RepID=UPI001FB2BBFC|nr:DUF5412 family protein [Priestia filamentosa]UOE62478.1 hypothetical protein HPB58_09995 [Priestia filamentosa]